METVMQQAEHEINELIKKHSGVHSHMETVMYWHTVIALASKELGEVIETQRNQKTSESS